MKKGTITFAMGILTGLALCGPAAQAADYLKATLSTQPIYVDGQRVSMTAYAINGNNYVRLRDIGQAVNFGVTYDAATNSVYIDSGAPYQAETPKPVRDTASPGTVTEESVKAALDALKVRYPLGSTYSAPHHSTSGGPYGTSISNCAGWAILCSDAAFGNLPWRKVDRPSWEHIRPGDLVEMRGGGLNHGVIVLERTEDYILTTESGTNQKVYWGRNTSAGGWRTNRPTFSTQGIQPEKLNNSSNSLRARLQNAVWPKLFGGIILKNHIFKRSLALFLALVCVMGILPLNAFAADATPPASITQISSAYVTINGKYVRYRAASSAINSIGLPYVFNEQVNIPGYGPGRALCTYQLGGLDHGLELSDCQHDHRQRGWHHHSDLTRCCNTFPFKYYDIV